MINGGAGRVVRYSKGVRMIKYTKIEYAIEVGNYSCYAWNRDDADYIFDIELSRVK